MCGGQDDNFLTILPGTRKSTCMHLGSVRDLYLGTILPVKCVTKTPAFAINLYTNLMTGGKKLVQAEFFFHSSQFRFYNSKRISVSCKNNRGGGDSLFSSQSFKGVRALSLRPQTAGERLSADTRYNFSSHPLPPSFSRVG
jgi:hypothetical protein